MLAIDEFQRTSGSDRHSPLALALQVLHEQKHGAPLMVVLAGLGETVTTAVKLGISPLSAEACHALDCFTPDEAADLVTGWGRHFELPEGSWQAEMRSLAAELGHWPVHVRYALSTFAEQLVAVRDIERVDFAAVRARSFEKRLIWHRRRLGSEIPCSMSLLEAVVRTLRPGEDAEDVKKRIGKLAGSCDAFGWRLPRGMDADDFFDHVVHKGALQEMPDGSVRCPVPSFRSFMIGYSKRRQFRRQA